MFENILVPVDLTPKNERAVRRARELATVSGGKVTLLHVIEMLDLPFEELREFYDRLQEKAIAHMERLAAGLEEADVPFEAHVVYGDRTDRIVQFARERDIDLIVLDSHRVEPDRPGRGFGTISYRVAILADCPVLLVKGKPSDPEGS